MFCFFNDTATTEIYTLSLHDALPICFTGDVLFKGTVGGTFAPGSTGYADLKASVLRLVDLPPETTLHPGHREPTTAGEDRKSTRLNSSHANISYAVFCLKKKKLATLL